MRQLRFVLIAFLTSLLVINAAFLRKTVAVLLCGVMSFNSASGNMLLGDYGKADAALSSARVTVSDHSDVMQEDGQKVAVCVFGVCVNVPNIPAVTPKVPSQNPPPPTTSPQQPANPDQQNPVAPDNEKPITDLTGTWHTDRLGSTCTVNNCTLATPSVPSLTVNGKTGRVIDEIKITQSGNQISIPDRKFVWNGGKYTYQYDGGNISGNKVTLNEAAVDTSVGWGYTNIYTGTVTADGNTVNGEVVYQPSTGDKGNNTAKTAFTWTREVSLTDKPCGIATSPNYKNSKIAKLICPPHPAYECSVFEKEFYNPYWRMFTEAANKHSAKHPEITPSLLAAIAAQESGKGNTGIPKNLPAKNVTVGIMQIDFGGAFSFDYIDPKTHKSVPKHFTKKQIFDPKATLNYPELAQYFNNFGITPVDATDVDKSIEWAAWELEQSFRSKYVKPYGIEGAIGYYKNGRHWQDKINVNIKEKRIKAGYRDWDIDSTSTIPDFVQKASIRLPKVKGQKDKISVPYIESVKWLQKLIEDAVNRCIVQQTGNNVR